MQLLRFFLNRLMFLSTGMQVKEIEPERSQSIHKQQRIWTTNLEKFNTQVCQGKLHNGTQDYQLIKQQDNASYEVYMKDFWS